MREVTDRASRYEAVEAPDELEEKEARRTSGEEHREPDRLQPSNKQAVQRLVPFDADDEPIAEAEESSTPWKVSSECDDAGRSGQEWRSIPKSMKNMELPSHKPKFVRKRPTANRSKENFQLFNSSKENIGVEDGEVSASSPAQRSSQCRTGTLKQSSVKL